MVKPGNNAGTVRAAVNHVTEKDEMGLGWTLFEIDCNCIEQTIELIKTAVDVADCIYPPAARNAAARHGLPEEWNAETHCVGNQPLLRIHDQVPILSV